MVSSLETEEAWVRRGMTGNNWHNQSQGFGGGICPSKKQKQMNVILADAIEVEGSILLVLPCSYPDNSYFQVRGFLSQKEFPDLRVLLSVFVQTSFLIYPIMVKLCFHICLYITNLYQNISNSLRVGTLPIIFVPGDWDIVKTSKCLWRPGKGKWERLLQSFSKNQVPT